MSRRKELEEMVLGIDENHKKAEDYHQLAYDLEDKINKVISSIIVEEEILAGTRWELRSNKVGEPHLEYVGKHTDQAFKQIKELINDGYYSNFPFEEEVHLQFEDGGMNIFFSDSSRVKIYIEKLKLIVDFSPIKGSVNKLRKDLMTLEMLCHQLNITV
jgi:hypothetical protein